MATVELDGVRKTYPGGQVAARGLDLRVEDGELLVLVGPSGCGKSTVLRMVAGLEAPSEGRVLIGGRDVTGVPPRDRDVAMVFQDYALYPHMTVRENLAFGLRMRGVDEAERRGRVDEVARTLGLDGLLDRRPARLSGGQRQRVALGRATVREPRVFLFDEPLSNLDARLRTRTRTELARLHRRFGATMLYVTHDQEEAMTLGQRVAVMNAGRLEQVARPMDVYREPATLFVAGFVGSPAMNLVPGRLRAGDGGATFEGPAFRLPVRDAAPAPAGRDAVLGVRPDDVELVAAGQGDVSTAVDVVEPLGGRVLVHGRAPWAAEGDDAVGGAVPGEPGLRAVVDPGDAPEEGARVGLRFRRDRLHLFDPGSGRRLAPGGG